jgi:hypothetical protein
MGDAREQPDMKRKPPARTHVLRAPPTPDDRFALVVDAFANDRQVSPPGTGKGFGSGALKVNGKIFAMMSSKGHFVVKLSAERVDALIAAGSGTRFIPGHGRPMKEWLVVTADHKFWLPLAKEARKLTVGR